MSRVVDVRLVERRDGTWSATVEGRPVPAVASGCPSFALAQLGRLVEGAAWASGREEAEELSLPASPLFTRRPEPTPDPDAAA